MSSDSRGVSNSFAKSISGIYWSLRSEVKKSLKEYGVGLGHIFFLQLIIEKEGINQEDLKKALSMDKGSVARSISKLVELGFIKKELNLNDKRAYKLYPTLRLKKLFPEIIEKMDKLIETRVVGVSPELFNATTSGLEEISEQMK